MAKTSRDLALAVALLASFCGPAVGQQLAAQAFPADVRGQVEDMMNRSVLAPPPSPATTCGTVTVGQEKSWTAPWKRSFSHHPSEWPWLRQYPVGTAFRFCQYTGRVAGTRPEIAYTAEVVTLNPSGAQLMGWMTNACRTAIQVTRASPARFDQCVRGLYWGLPLSAPDDRKQVMGIRQFSGGQFVVAGAVTEDASRGGVVCYRDGVALLRERPGLPAIGYFVMTETADGRTVKAVTDGQLAECFKIASPREWPGSSAARLAGTTRDQFWNALARLERSPAEFGLSVRADLDPSEAWRRVVREAHLAALRADRNVLIDAFALAHADALLR